MAASWKPRAGRGEQTNARSLSHTRTHTHTQAHRERIGLAAPFRRRRRLVVRSSLIEMMSGRAISCRRSRPARQPEVARRAAFSCCAGGAKGRRGSDQFVRFSWLRLSSGGLATRSRRRWCAKMRTILASASRQRRRHDSTTRREI
jgi:hypothetical protein